MLTAHRWWSSSFHRHLLDVFDSSKASTLCYHPPSTSHQPPARGSTPVGFLRARDVAVSLLPCFYFLFDKRQTRFWLVGLMDLVLPDLSKPFDRFSTIRKEGFCIKCPVVLHFQALYLFDLLVATHSHKLSIYRCMCWRCSCHVNRFAVFASVFCSYVNYDMMYIIAMCWRKTYLSP